VELLNTSLRTPLTGASALSDLQRNSRDLSFRPNLFDSDRLQRLLTELDDDIYRKKKELHQLMNSSATSLSALKSFRSDRKKPQVSPHRTPSPSLTADSRPTPFWPATRGSR
jgi:hypothetical protein